MKILGLGNALVDILLQMNDDQMLKELNLPKGSMQLIDAKQAEQIKKKTENMSSNMVSGGSAANTMHGLAKLGARATYIGKISDDELGHFFKENLEKANIEATLLKSKTPTGQANTFISPDSERTFATYLGAAVEMVPEELSEELFLGHDLLHIEGYLVQNYALVEKAFQLAKKCGMKISLDLASYNVVEGSLEFLEKMIPGYVDIVFANEEEAKAYTGREPEEALEEIAKVCEIAVVKIGKEGSMIKVGDAKYTIGVIECKPVDTTGAGDQYAAGFLYGMVEKLPYDKCGQLGALLAGTVIERYGARIADDCWDEVLKQVKIIMD